MKKLTLIIFVLLIASLSYSQVYSADIAFLTYIKNSNTTLTDGMTKDFLRSHHYDEFMANSTDEFSQKEYIDSMFVELKHGVDTINLSNQYWIPVFIKLGQYDFEQNYFPILYDENFTSGEMNGPGVSKCSYIGKSENIGKYKHLKIAPDVAKDIVEKLKAIGNIERRVLCFLYFKFNGKTNRITTNNGEDIAYSMCDINLIQIRTRGLETIDIKSNY